MLSTKEKSSNLRGKIRSRKMMIWAIVFVLLTTNIGFANINDGLVGYWSFDNPGKGGYPLNASIPTYCGFLAQACDMVMGPSQLLAPSAGRIAFLANGMHDG